MQNYMLLINNNLQSLELENCVLERIEMFEKEY